MLVIMQILICAAAFLLRCSIVNCKVEYVKCEKCDQLIVDTINDFRANLICNKGVSFARRISSSDMIFNNESVNDLPLPAMTNSLLITHESCESEFLVDELPIDESVANFIKHCAVLAENLENLKYSWFWNPETRRIHCAYSIKPFRISCVANELSTDNFSDIFDLDVSVKASVEEYKTFRSNLRYCKHLKNSHGWLKMCPARLVVRENIQNEINTFRQMMVVEKNISNMPCATWNTELQMVASEFGKLWAPEYRNINCISSSQFSKVQIFYLSLYTSVFDYERYLNPVADIIFKVRHEIVNTTRSGARPDYFWIYDTTVTDFGCVFQMTSRIYANLVCAHNGDLENDVSSNFKYGTPCSSCPDSYECDGLGNSTVLCRSIGAGLPYKYFLIYGSLVFAGFATYFHLRHRTQ